MRKSISCLAFAALATGLPAAAQEIIVPGKTEVRPPRTQPAPTTTKQVPDPSPWYVGGEFGAMIVEDMNIDIGASNNAITVNHEYGYDGGIFVGHDFGAFRVEAEVAHKKADLDDYQTSIRLPLEGPNFAAGREASGSTTALSFMINGMLDFGDEEGISGFVGGGVGMARVKANNYRNFANATPFLDDSDSGLAWQAFAGVRQRIRDNIDVTVKYRFFNASKVEMVAFNGQQSEHRFRSHSLLGGITFRFGGTRTVEVCQSNGEPISAANPCTVTVCEEGFSLAAAGQCERKDPDMKHCRANDPLVPLDTKLDCAIGPFDVYFGWDKRQIGEPAEPGEDPRENADFIRSQPTIVQGQVEELQAAYAAYQQAGTVRVNIVGRADRSGDEKYNQVLSCDRAHAVRKYFLDRNVPASDIQIEGRGETDAQGAVDREPQDRRVSITINDSANLAGCPPPSPKMKP